MRDLNAHDKGKDVKRLQQAINTRLSTRSAPHQTVKVDGDFGPKTRQAMAYACYLLGMNSAVITSNIKHGSISPAEQNFVLHPGKRNDAQKQLGRKRVARHRQALKKAEEQSHKASAKRKAIVDAWKQAAHNYRQNPGAYHYLAGGIANTEIMKPTPSNWRSDCSMFVASGYKDAGVESPAAPLDHQWAATSTIVKSPHARITDNPKPGDLGMYGDRTGPLASRYTHHVEGYVGEPDCKFIGHGSPPIDSLTPGEPDFYVTFDFLD